MFRRSCIHVCFSSKRSRELQTVGSSGSSLGSSCSGQANLAVLGAGGDRFIGYLLLGAVPKIKIHGKYRTDLDYNNSISRAVWFGSLLLEISDQET
jgi:hypothetical protein